MVCNKFWGTSREIESDPFSSCLLGLVKFVAAISLFTLDWRIPRDSWLGSDQESLLLNPPSTTEWTHWNSFDQKAGKTHHSFWAHGRGKEAVVSPHAVSYIIFPNIYSTLILKTTTREEAKPLGKSWSNDRGGVLYSYCFNYRLNQDHGPYETASEETREKIFHIYCTSSASVLFFPTRCSEWATLLPNAERGSLAHVHCSFLQYLSIIGGCQQTAASIPCGC